MLVGYLEFCAWSIALLALLVRLNREAEGPLHLQNLVIGAGLLKR